ncbi:thiamine pyrophosphate-dependent enzyme [Actinopolymorpha pittospori]|uniref:Acetolactate synthase-1/2/3 large subunit n=1 Tax=Actinopolymorpha pittospori TaxID=648752 RepID=A0A927RPM0_9ACTN|nr:thiamine pyrophosphate-dependent enzyme [Actinopolymorpha pittospori]MBE1611298.1 acetolactate synthase-1/2/3 large subunit [Actinopolymorpha pittospori]
MSETVARTVVRLLADAGVRTAYTVPGESFLPLLDAWEAEPRVRLISTRHEAGAAFMAEAEAKLTGRPALALASRGPGAANLSIGVHTAQQDQTPLIAILGQVESEVRGREAFQEVDLASFYAPITTWSREPWRPEEVPALVARAFRDATSARPGPVALSVPADFWSATFEGAVPHVLHPQAGPDVVVANAAEAVVAGAVIAQASQKLATLLATARAPVVITGPGERVGRDSLRRASEQLGFGVYAAFRRQDSFDEDHPHFLGHLGLGVPDSILRALRDADVVVVAGTRLDAVTSQNYRYPLPHQHLVMLGTGLPVPHHPGRTTRLEADPRAVLDGLATQPGAMTKRDWVPYHDAAREYAVPPDHAAPSGETTKGRVHPASVITGLREVAPDDVILTNDAGNFSAFFHRYWRFRTSHRLLAPCNGAMGYAVPAAVAAKLAAPERSVVALVGDGGILMTGQEIETALRYDAPIVVLAFQNGMYGTIAMHQAATQGRLAGVDIGRLDLAAWARGLGAHGLTIDDPTQIDATLREALRCGRPCVVDVRTDPDVIAPGRRLSEML